jgi:hypothetical protein
MRQFQFRLRLLALAGATLLLGMMVAHPASAAPPKTVTARALKPRPHTLRPGTSVRASDVFGVRAFPTAQRGFALAGVGQAQ